MDKQRRPPGVKTVVVLHYKDGRVVSESIAKFATANGCASLQDAYKLLWEWINDGSLVPRKTGGFDVKRFRPRNAANRTVKLTELGQSAVL